MLELNMMIWDIFCIRKIWSNSFVQKIQKIQHASLTAIKKFSQNFYFINLNVENLIELKATIKWACENNVKQDENSNQYFYLHHDFYLKYHFCQYSSNLQHNHQINISSQDSHLILITVRKTKKQKNHI